MSDDVFVRIMNPSELLPQSQAWDEVPSELTLAGHPSIAGTKPYAVAGHAVEVVAVRSDHGPGVLVLLDDESAADEVTASIRSGMVVPTVITVRGREPQTVRDALAALLEVPPSRSLVRFAAVPRPAWDSRFFQPIVDAEARRGNRGVLYFGDNRGGDAAYLFAGPIDREALVAEFEFDDGIELTDPERPRIRYRSEDGATRWVLAGSGQFRNATMTQKRDEWWREWRAKPRPLVRVHNPFRHPDALPPLTPPQPVILASVPAGLTIGEQMSDALPGLGAGWSVWPFTSADGPGLLVISPDVRAPETPRVLDAGGTTLPVLLVARGKEPAEVAAAMSAARIGSAWPR